jgi:Uma2 family endonuclease
MAAAPDVSLEFLRPPEQGWTADDLDRIPNLPTHTELLDGGLFFMSPQKAFHRKVIDLLVRELIAQLPAGHQVVREMSVWIDRYNRPEPDVMVLKPGTPEDDDTTWHPVAAVLLAVEVVSPDSAKRDEQIKPIKYAEAGIRHYWRIDRDAVGEPVCYTYELDPATSRYQPAGVCHGVIKTNRPFDLAIDLNQR